jgi:exonuclease III
MKIISWNCRGLGSQRKKEAMKDLIRISNLDILLVQETKLEESEFLQTSARLWEKGAGAMVSVRGASGGIGSLWNSSTLEILKIENYTQWILTILLHKESGIQVSIFNLYVLVLPEEKKVCWNKLREFLDMHQIENIIIVGDLMSLYPKGEKRGNHY